MRFLDKQDGIKELSELHLSERQSGIVNSTMTRDQGLVLVTGPTGSGKRRHFMRLLILLIKMTSISTQLRIQ